MEGKVLHFHTVVKSLTWNDFHGRNFSFGNRNGGLTTKITPVHNIEAVIILNNLSRCPKKIADNTIVKSGVL